MGVFLVLYYTPKRWIIPFFGAGGNSGWTKVWGSEFVESILSHLPPSIWSNLFVFWVLFFHLPFRKETGLSSTIPSSISNLRNTVLFSLGTWLNIYLIVICLFSFKLSPSWNIENNQLTGSIPSEIGNMKSLTYLDLSE